MVRPGLRETGHNPSMPAFSLDLFEPGSSPKTGQPAILTVRAIVRRQDGRACNSDI